MWPRTLLLHTNGGTLRLELIKAQRKTVVARIACPGSTVQTHNVQQKDTVATAVRSRRGASSPSRIHSSNKSCSSSAHEHADTADQVFVWLDAVPTVMRKQEHQDRLTSINLWLQHLQELKNGADFEQLALKAAFGDPASMEPRTATHVDLHKLWQASKRLRNALQLAIPFSSTDPQLQELISLTEELENVESKESLQQIRALLHRRMLGKRTAPSKRRELFNRAALAVQCRPEYDQPRIFTPVYITDSEDDVSNIPGL